MISTRSLEDFEIEAAVETVLEAIHELYVKASARHFLLIDLPPLERFPVGQFRLLLLLAALSRSY